MLLRSMAYRVVIIQQHTVAIQQYPCRHHLLLPVVLWGIAFWAHWTNRGPCRLSLPSRGFTGLSQHIARECSLSPSKGNPVWTPHQGDRVFSVQSVVWLCWYWFLSCVVNDCELAVLTVNKWFNMTVAVDICYVCAAYLGKLFVFINEVLSKPVFLPFMATWGTLRHLRSCEGCKQTART